MSNAKIVSCSVKHRGDAEPFVLSDTHITKVVIRQSVENIAPKLEVVFLDNQELRAQSEMRGGFKLSLKMMDSLENSIDLDWEVDSIKEIMSDAGGSTYLFLEAYLANNFHLLQERLYRSYELTKVSEIVKSLVPGIVTLPSSENLNLTCPGWTKNKFLQFLSYQDYSAKEDVSYMYYETIKNINFLPLAELMKVTRVSELNNYVVKSNPNHQLSLIDMREIKSYSMMVTLNKGLTKAETRYFDFKTKKFITRDVDVSSKELSIEKDSLYLPRVEEIAAKVVHLGAVKRIENEVMNKIIPQRFSKTYELLVNGDFNLVPGMLLSVTIPDNYKDGELSGEHSGIYLISKMAHHIEGGTFKTKMEIVKNSLYNSKQNNKAKTIL